MPRRKHARRWAVVIALASAVAFVPQSPSHADEWYPGLPDATFGNWSSASSGGLSYATRAKQWFRSPQAMSAAEFWVESVADTVTGITPGWIYAEGYFVSPAGAPENYGYMEPMTVRSVGFGLMPVEASVQVSQRRKNGYPIPVAAEIITERIRTPAPGGGLPRVDMYFQGMTIKDAFNVQILSVRVDGVDLELTGNCRTVAPAPVIVSSPDYSIQDMKPSGPGSADDWYLHADPEEYWHPLRGGQMSGTMSIPAFTGCTTRTGDDLSDLMTLSVSGPDNPVSVRTGWPCVFPAGAANSPAPPGASNPRIAGEFGGYTDGMDTCAGSEPFEYPERDD